MCIVFLIAIYFTFYHNEGAKLKQNEPDKNYRAHYYLN